MEVRRVISVINHEMVNKVKNSENSDSASSVPDDVFSDGFNSLECVEILINCLKSIQLQVKKTFCAPRGQQKFSNYRRKAVRFSSRCTRVTVSEICCLFICCLVIAVL